MLNPEEDAQGGRNEHLRTFEERERNQNLDPRVSSFVVKVLISLSLSTFKIVEVSKVPSAHGRRWRVPPPGDLALLVERAVLLDVDAELWPAHVDTIDAGNTGRAMALERGECALRVNASLRRACIDSYRRRTRKHGG